MDAVTKYRFERVVGSSAYSRPMPRGGPSAMFILEVDRVDRDATVDVIVQGANVGTNAWWTVATYSPTDWPGVFCVDAPDVPDLWRVKLTVEDCGPEAVVASPGGAQCGGRIDDGSNH